LSTKQFLAARGLEGKKFESSVSETSAEFHTLEERNMGTRSLSRIIAIAILAAVSVATVAQTQTQQGQSQNQNQSQQSQGQQPAPPAQKLSVWQKIKNQANAAKQTGQNTVQQGQNTVQQGTQQVQQGVQGVQQGAQQGVQGVQQQIVPGGSQANGGGASSCGSSCFDAGPFQANVSQMTMSQQGPWHIIRMNVQFHNSTNQPLIIAYHDGSMVMVDNNGNTYQGAGGNPGQLQGMGIDRGNQTDSQFVLDPGQTGNAMFSVARAMGNDSPIGTAYTYNLTIDELQAQNGAMAIPVRTYNLNFPSIAPSSVSSSTAAFPSGSSPAKGFAGGGTGTRTSYVGTAGPQSNTQGAPGQRGVAVPAQQQRMVNGKPAPTTPAAAVNNAAMKTAATTTTTAKPSAVVKPIPATTTTKTTTPPKKTTTNTTTTTTTTSK